MTSHKYFESILSCLLISWGSLIPFINSLMEQGPNCSKRFIPKTLVILFSFLCILLGKKLLLFRCFFLHSLNRSFIGHHSCIDTYQWCTDNLTRYFVWGTHLSLSKSQLSDFFFFPVNGRWLLFFWLQFSLLSLLFTPRPSVRPRFKTRPIKCSHSGL